MSWLSKNWRDILVISTICAAVTVGTWNIRVVSQNTKAIEEMNKIITIQVMLNERNIQWREDHEKLHEIERLIPKPQ